MQLLKRLAGSENNQKKSTHMVRFVGPLVLAFLVFGFVGVFSSGRASAHATTSTCGNVTVSGPSEMVGYFGDGLATISLIQNTCTGLYHAEGVCAVPESISLDIFVDVLVKGTPNVSTYNTLNATCTTAGQTFDTAPLAYVQKSFFCADGSTPSGSGDACIGLQFG